MMEVFVTTILGVVWGARMREFVSDEIICKDRHGNEITVYEVSLEKDFGSPGQPDLHVQKDRYETARRSPVVSLDGAAFQLVDSGEVVRSASRQANGLSRPSWAA
jgi:hypothetical protein